jgi:hypothetical protein
VSRSIPEKPSLHLTSDKCSLYPAIAGFVFYLTYVIGLMLLAEKKFPELFLLFYAILIWTICYWILKNNGWFTLPHLSSFGIGDYCALSFTALLVGLRKGSSEIITTGILFIVLFATTIILIHRKQNNRNFPAKQST